MIVGAVISAITGSMVATAVTLIYSFGPIHVAMSYPLGGMLALMVFSAFVYQKQRFI